MDVKRPKLKTTKYLKKEENNLWSSSLLFLLLLISADLAFVWQYFSWRYIPLFNKSILEVSETWGNLEVYQLNQNLFAITKDWSYPEVYQYVKLFWIVILALFTYKKTKELGYIAWASLFSYALFDDSLRFHENLGAKVAENMDFHLVFGLRPQEYGELLVTAAAGVLLLTFIASYYWRGSFSFKKASQDLLLLILLIAFFGVFVDLLHIALSFLGTGMSIVLGVIEDGGEMLATSLLAWYVFLLANRQEPLKTSLGELTYRFLKKRLRLR